MDIFCDDNPECPGDGEGSIGGLIIVAAVTTAVGVLVTWGLEWVKNNVEIRLRRPEGEPQPYYYMEQTPEEDDENAGE